jgi:nitric oxide reductase NorD protein
MGEPEGLLIEGARLAAAGTRQLWWRVRPPGAAAVLALAQVRRRLELFLGALHGEPVPILPADPEPAPTWLARLLGRAPRHLAPAEALAATDGERVWLPRALDARAGEDAALDRYRLLAVEQAARRGRGVARGQPHDAPRIERDLYRVAEGAAVDRALARDLPGLIPALRDARAAALAARPAIERLPPAEQAVERAVRAVLAAEPLAPPPELAAVETPGAARAWARAQARQPGAAGRYRGVAPVALWGTPRLPAPAPGAREGEPPPASPPRPARSAALRRGPRARPAADDEDDAAPGMWMVRFDDPMESAEDPMGLQRPADQGDSPEAAELADALSELPEARIVRTPGSPREVLESDGPSAAGPAEGPRPRRDGPGITYPEWDHRLPAYRFPGAVVRPVRAPGGDAAWANGVLDRHAALVRRVRRRFDGLRPRRVRLGRQPDGADVDLGAYVTAFADRRAGEPGDDRLYTAARPARRDLAITVLVDVSASTDAWVAGSRRVVDVEKEALVVLLEALDVLGDRHAVLAFSGQGPRAVHLLTIRGFDETSPAPARRRIAALEPDGYTRVGAAIRHATALLGRERARHRLLLVLSDGKPNDVDEYAGRYGIEDTRQAVAEARLQGLLTFCLTVDREAPTYLPAIFGPRGYAVLPRPELLPTVLVEVLRSLVTT